MNYFKIFNSNKNAGFSLVELMVVITIITIILSAMVSRQNTFQERFRVDSKVYDLAIAIRQAQAYTLGVREFACSSNGSKTFDVSYGVHLNTANLNQFAFFVDANEDSLYNSPENGAGSCYTQITSLTTPGITRICGVVFGGSKQCYPADGSIRDITLTFQRPNPRPVMKFVNSGGSEITSLQNHANAAMYVYFGYNNQPGEIELKLEATGQVSIKYCGATCP